jgi:hypothetical protein
MSLKCSISVGLYWVILRRVSEVIDQIRGSVSSHFNAIALESHWSYGYIPR